MAIKWDDVHVGINHKTNGIFMGKSRITPSGLAKWLEKSRDKTDEIIRTVAYKMRADLNNRTDGRPYVGYEVPSAGTLVLVKTGYEISVTKKK